MDYAPVDDHWVAAPEDAAYGAAPTTYEDIVAMADLDGDPSVISDEEREMIALLSQVLGASPVTN